MQHKILFAAAFAVVAMQAAVTAAPKAVTEGFKRVYPQEPVISVEQTAVPGIYEIISGGNVIYATGDGRFLFAGSILDTVNGRDLTENTRRRLRRAALAGIGENRMVTYVPDNHQYTVNVFTDVECGYCRKFHAHMPELLKLGVRVNYLLTPFRGKNAHAKAVGVWCARDRNAAMDRAKAGKTIPLKQCDNPVEDHLRLAELVGVRGTPGVLLDSGTFLRGYRPPKELLKALKRDERLRGGGRD